MRYKIVVADDDFDNRTIVQEVLEAAGYCVILAVDGLEAFETTTKEKPDVLLLDLSMPKLNGWEVAKRLRLDSTLSNTTIIAFTAHALVGDELKAKAAGCDDYLSKPCLPKEVVHKITSWVTKKEAAGRVKSA